MDGKKQKLNEFLWKFYSRTKSCLLLQQLQITQTQYNNVCEQYTNTIQIDTKQTSSTVCCKRTKNVVNPVKSPKSGTMSCQQQSATTLPRFANLVWWCSSSCRVRGFCLCTLRHSACQLSLLASKTVDWWRNKQMVKEQSPLFADESERSKLDWKVDWFCYRWMSSACLHLARILAQKKVDNSHRMKVGVLLKYYKFNSLLNCKTMLQLKPMISTLNSR